MINLPILQRLDVLDYGLFPGSADQEAGLHIDFRSGLTLILGANGLGKSTLVAMLYRMLTGPFDIPLLAGRVDLGTIRLTPTPLSTGQEAVFAQRVMDNARNASAQLSFQLGGQVLLVERRLSDLGLTRLLVDGRVITPTEEETYQATLRELTGIRAFGDWILLLRYLVFYFEDRRALVWDASAQRQLLRFLFLAPPIEAQWAEDERSILELDSRTRNLSAALYREERALARSEIKISTAPEVREELRTLEDLQGRELEVRERLEQDLPELEAERQRTRLTVLKGEQEREALFRELERSKLIALEGRFPEQSESARYILAQLMTGNQCLVCGNAAASAAAEYGSRVSQNRCVVCDTPIAATSPTSVVEIADRRIERVQADLEKMEAHLGSARVAHAEATNRFGVRVTEIANLNARIADRSFRIDSLVRRLPPAEADMHTQRGELAVLRSRVEELKQDLVAKRQAFTRLIDEANRHIVEHSAAIKNAFDGYAQGFLLEACRLSWSPRREPLGQSGEMIGFPAFELEMTGTDFPTAVRRSGPEQVSESQREFIDLSFRMALMAVAGSGGLGTLVIDAPESSLDGVFESRAARVLAQFANRGNRLIVTSNLVQGQLIPQLLGATATDGDRRARVVDLLEVAVPTAAVRDLRDEYARVRDSLLGDSR